MKLQPIERKKRWLIIICILLLVILCMGTSWLIIRAGTQTGKDQNSAHYNVSATAATHATATALAQPLFQDNFANNTHGWSTNNLSGYTRAIQNNQLLLTNTNHTVLVESLPTTTTFTNFSLTTTLTLAQADSADSVGLYLRGDSNLDHDYRIDIFGNTTYAVGKESLDTNNNVINTFLIPPTSSAFLHPVGQPNTLTVTMDGIQLTEEINGHLVASLTDSDYTHGQIALFVSNSDISESTTAAFSSITIYSLLPEK
jgi:hypothetical protein